MYFKRISKEVNIVKFIEKKFVMGNKSVIMTINWLMLISHELNLYWFTRIIRCRNEEKIHQEVQKLSQLQKKYFRLYSDTVPFYRPT